MPNPLVPLICVQCLTKHRSLFPKRLFKFGRDCNSILASHSCLWDLRLSHVLSNKIWGWDSESTGFVIVVLGLSELGGVSSVSITSGLGSNSDDSGMDSAGNAVALLEIDFWEMEVLGVSVVIFNVFFGGLVDELLHGESHDGLILGDLSVAVEADHSVSVTLILLTSSVVSSL